MTRLHLLRAAVALLLALYACGPAEPAALLYAEPFEVLCDGAPCGWTRVTGEPDQARWIETIHPGEHGLALRGAVTVRGPAAGPDDEPVVSENLWVRLAARCDQGSALRLEILFADESAVVGSAAGEARPAPEWVDTTVVALGWDGGPDLRELRVASVTVQKTGAGECEISEILIDDLGPDHGCE